MRILTLNYEFPPLGGGAAPVTEELAANLCERGHTVDVVTMAYDDLPREEERRGATVYRVPAMRSSKSRSAPHEMMSYLPGGFLKARQLLSENEYDAVHSHFIVPTGSIAYVLDELYDVPYHVTAHGSDVPGYNPDRFTALHRVVQPVWKRVSANAETVVAPSQHLADMITSVDGTVPTRVIPNGFEYEQFDHETETAERILVTSRLFERKGIQYFLRALAECEPDWEVVVTGEGPYRERLEYLASSLETEVSFPGWVSRGRLEELLETSAIYVFPSSHENCPVALQEAMAAGCAILASENGGTGEVIGDAGLVTDPRDVTEFAAKLQRLIGSPGLRAELRQHARDRVVSEYDWQEIGDQYVDVLK